jgi:hypothetical protein
MCRLNAKSSKFCLRLKEKEIFKVSLGVRRHVLRCNAPELFQHLILELIFELDNRLANQENPYF